ncbi:unnamed protein product [Calicophoron daubneyi]|uniref:BSD domain-containing protein n=1 Tax=Calicophoron daubneyi TaxID=300641 RepID=A0AAV2TYL7_CALDB
MYLRSQAGCNSVDYITMLTAVKGFFSTLLADDEVKEKAESSGKSTPTAHGESEEEKKDSASGDNNVSSGVKETLNSALNWGSNLYKKALESGESTAKLLADKVTSVELESTWDKVPLFHELQQAQAEFEAKQKAEAEQLAKAPVGSDLLPWHPDASGISDPAALEALRIKILALSQQESTFLLPPPKEAQLSETSAGHTLNLQLAVALLEEDPNLGKMRYQLVPFKISEDLFWRNYFYRVSLVRQSAHLSAMTAVGSDESADGGDFVHIEKNALWNTDDQDSRIKASSEKNDPSLGKGRVRNPTPQKAPQIPTSEPTGRKSNKSHRKHKPPVDKSGSSSPEVVPHTDKSHKSADQKTTDRSVEEMLEEELALEVSGIDLSKADECKTDEIDRELELELEAEMNKAHPK